MSPARAPLARQRAGLRIQPLELPAGAARPGPAVLAEHLADLGPVALLEAAGSRPGWSYLAPALAGRLRSVRGGMRLETTAGRRRVAGEPCVVLERFCRRLGLTPDAPRPADAPAFTGGLVGAVGYDLARDLESIGMEAAADRGPAGLELHLAETVLALPPEGGDAWLIQRPLVSPPERLDEVAAAVRARLQAPTPQPEDPPPAPRTVSTSLTAAAYRGAVGRLLSHIGAGDIFQANLSQRLTARWEASPWSLYRRLAATSPAPHGAVVPLGAGAAVSVSPETFLRAHGREVVTRPIKGTRRRGGGPDEDRRLAGELRASAKDRAENVMIVDVQRNDLGKVCATGSVATPRLAELVAHPTVWHLESEVTGRLADGVGWGGLLAACFPCGSVTGAPKIRAMQLIEQLEPVRRGWYCGAIGFLAPGRLELSVAIRTAVVGRGVADYGTGGGVVADSDPRAEHAESLDKAAAFLQAVAATGIDRP